MNPSTIQRGGMAAAVLATLAAAACEYATVPLTPAERARIVRTAVDAGQGSTDRILRAGYAVPVVARVTDKVNQPVAGALVMWISGARSGTVSPASGLTDEDGRTGTTWTTGTQAGLQELVAAVDSNMNAVDLTRWVVFADTVVGLLVLDAVRDSVVAGDTTRVRVIDAQDRYGNPYVLSGTQPDNPPPIEFTSLDLAVATLVSSTGRAVLLTGVAPGTARIVARSGGKADTIDVVVNPAPAPAPSRAPR
jgi:hypothetical protein